MGGASGGKEKVQEQPVVVYVHAAHCPPFRGRQWHEEACPRTKFTPNGVLPVVGSVVKCIQSAGPRAGQVWRCEKVDRKGWVQVLPEATDVQAVGAAPVAP